MRNIKRLFWVTILTIAVSVFHFSCLKDVETRTYEQEMAELDKYVKEEGITGNQLFNGMYYVEQTAGTGMRAEIYDVVVIEYVGYLIDGTEFGKNKPDEEFSFQLGTGQVISGLDYGIRLMHEGEKAKLVIPSPLGYGYYQTGSIPSYSTLIIEVELIEVRRKNTVEPFSTEGAAYEATESGMQYYIIEKGAGKEITTGTMVDVHYTGFLDNGFIFDSTVKKGESATFEVGIGKLIDGWEEALQLMQDGDKFKVIMPPGLAYGKYGKSPSIPPNAYLTFDIEIIKVH